MFEILRSVRRFIKLLPPESIYCFTLTDELPAIFNVYVQDEEERLRIRKCLGLTHANRRDETDYFETYRIALIDLSIIEGEEDVRFYRATGAKGSRTNGKT